VWHGGEPLLAGIEKFKEILQIQKKFNINFINSIQTNATLINKTWAEFFKENNFIVGFSLDGPKKIQDIHRYNKNKESSFDLTIKGVNILKEYGIKLNTIGVISNESEKYVSDVYNFAKEIEIKTIDLIPSFCYDDEETLSAEKYTNYMLQLLDLWKKDDYEPLEIRHLNDIFKRVINRYSNNKLNVGCSLSGCCGQNFSIGVEGEVFPCECLTPIPSFQLGNILESDFSELINSEGFMQLKTSFNNIAYECYNCEMLDLCRAGCLNRRLHNYNLNNGKDIYCESKKILFNEVINIINNNEKLPSL
jgi:uncharacterized protein